MNCSQGCYKFKDALSPDPNPILDRINTKNIEYIPSGHRESGLAGVYRTAAEPKMKWTRGRNVEDGLLRIMFVVSDDVTHTGRITSQQKLELKGDGTDDCAKSHNPTEKQVGEILKKDEMAVYMLYADTAYITGKDTLQSWTKTLQKAGTFHRINELNSTSHFNRFKTFVVDFKNRLGPAFITCADPPPYNTLGL